MLSSRLLLLLLLVSTVRFTAAQLAQGDLRREHALRAAELMRMLGSESPGGPSPARFACISWRRPVWVK
jgi:hypothetical protein